MSSQKTINKNFMKSILQKKNLIKIGLAVTFGATPVAPAMTLAASAGPNTEPCGRPQSRYLRGMTGLVKTAPAELALDSRAGWPADLRLLIDR